MVCNQCPRGYKGQIFSENKHEVHGKLKFKNQSVQLYDARYEKNLGFPSNESCSDIWRLMKLFKSRMVHSMCSWITGAFFKQRHVSFNLVGECEFLEIDGKYVVDVIAVWPKSIFSFS